MAGRIPRFCRSRRQHPVFSCRVECRRRLRAPGWPLDSGCGVDKTPHKSARCRGGPSRTSAELRSASGVGGKRLKNWVFEEAHFAEVVLAFEAHAFTHERNHLRGVAEEVQLQVG